MDYLDLIGRGNLRRHCFYYTQMYSAANFSTLHRPKRYTHATIPSIVKLPP